MKSPTCTVMVYLMFMALPIYAQYPTIQPDSHHRNTSENLETPPPANISEGTATASPVPVPNTSPALSSGVPPAQKGNGTSLENPPVPFVFERGQARESTTHFYTTPPSYIDRRPNISSRLQLKDSFLSEDLVTSGTLMQSGGGFMLQTDDTTKAASATNTAPPPEGIAYHTILIEAKVISIDTSDDRTLGVEISGGDRTGDKKLFSFSHFGMSSLDGNGKLGLDTTKALGLNGVLVNPETADVIVRALSENSHVKVESSPRILVVNTGKGHISSTLGIPYAGKDIIPSIEMSTNVLKGYQEVGTVIEIVPTTIGETDIHLSFIIQHSNYVASQTLKKEEILPPAIHADNIKTNVIIPNKHTVIVGGLNRFGISKEEKGIPFLINIPLIKHLASSQLDKQSRTTLFFFITATIVQEKESVDKFEKLKNVTGQIPGLELNYLAK